MLKSRIYFLPLLAALAAVLFVAGCSLQNGQGNKAENVAHKPAPASPKIPETEPVARVASQVEPSVVQVNVRSIQMTPFGNQAQEGLGSGVIYRKDGYIITNNHVVQGASQVNVAFADGSTERGQVVGTDPTTDIAVVKVNRNNLPAAKFRKSENLVPGQLAVAIGSPSGFQSTVTAGIISGLNREIPASLTGGTDTSLVDLIQTDAAISPGNSGGALVDRAGEIIGINVAYLPQTQTGQLVEGIGFAIPSDTAVSVADQLIANGKAVHPYLGIQLADLTPEAAKQFNLKVDSGVVVRNVVSGSAASNAGVRSGDIITAIDNRKIADSGDLLGDLRDYKPGDQVKITIVRNGNKKTLNVTLDQAPQQQQQQ
ncbi:MAG TPA: trypsin-like peptidase domain-containing protein [Rubrobacteraceae bacterium]|nr:trypsin-like peptidase domain-containing protein [Rubrobacteraceae bacterium]